MQTALNDLRSALRGLRRTPAFAAGAIVVLGLSIGVNLAVFTVANASLFKGFRVVPEQDRLVYITTARDCCVSYLDLRDWRAAATSFAAMAAVADLRVSVDTGVALETATATEVTAELFGLLRVRPMLGRDFAPSDDIPGASRVAILSAEFWRTRFGADAAVVGQTIRVNGEPTTIVGVMPQGFAFPQQQDLWLPLGPRVSDQPRNGRGLWFAVGRLVDGVTIDRARAELNAVGERLEALYPATNAGVRPVLQTFRDFFIGPNALAIYGALWGGVGLLVVIACANFVNLLSARAVSRTREAGVRLALGAGRASTIRLQLFESTAVAIGGGVVGWWMATLMLRAYASVAVPPTQPWAAQLLDYSVDLRAFAYLVGMSIVVGVATGLVPAIRTSMLDVQDVLRDGGRGAVGRRHHHRLSASIIAVQVALAVVLLAAAGVLLRSFWIVHTRDVGYDPARVLVALTSLPASSYPDAEAQLRFFDRAASGVRAIPGVAAVAFIDGLSGQGGGRVAVEIEGRVAAAADRLQVRQLSITPGYFNTLGKSVGAGRDFDDSDAADAQPAVIVNQRFVNMHWRRGDAIGRRLRVFSLAAAGPWLTVVGVAPNLHHGDRALGEIEPVIYRPLRQRPARGAWIVVHSSVSPRSLIEPLRRQIQLADPTLPVWLGPYTLEQWNAGAYWRRGVNGGLFALFAGLALMLACIGLFAMAATTVAHRRQEIGVRIALGASGANVTWLVVRQGLTPAFVGLAAGLVLAMATNRLLAAQLVEVEPWDSATFAMITALIVASTAVGCLIPALQATRVAPVNAIRMN